MPKGIAEQLQYNSELRLPSLGSRSHARHVMEVWSAYIENTACASLLEGEETLQCKTGDIDELALKDTDLGSTIWNLEQSPAIRTAQNNNRLARKKTDIEKDMTSILTQLSASPKQKLYFRLNYQLKRALALKLVAGAITEKTAKRFVMAVFTDCTLAFGAAESEPDNPINLEVARHLDGLINKTGYENNRTATNITRGIGALTLFLTLAFLSVGIIAAVPLTGFAALAVVGVTAIAAVGTVIGGVVAAHKITQAQTDRQQLKNMKAKFITPAMTEYNKSLVSAASPKGTTAQKPTIAPSPVLVKGAKRAAVTPGTDVQSKTAVIGDTLGPSSRPNAAL